MFGSGQIQRDDLWTHELTHGEAFEAICVLLAALFAATCLAGVWWLGLIALALGPLALAGAGMATAWLRGERDAYLGSNLEESARAVACCRRRDIDF